MNGQDLESLHEQASGHYLRGELDSAARVWERVLSFDPSDERAQEGVRLCRQMGGFDEITENDAELATLGDDDLDQLDIKLDLGGGGKQDGPGLGQDPPAEANENEGFLDLSGLADDVGVDRDLPRLAVTGNDSYDAAPSLGEPRHPDANPDEVPMPRDGVSASESSLWQWSAADADPLTIDGASDGASWDSAAAIELRRRVNELMASALVHIEEGRQGEALQTLGRLLILDEENDSALALKAKLEGDGRAQAPEREPSEESPSAPVRTRSAAPRVESEGPRSIPLDRPPAPAPALTAPARGRQAPPSAETGRSTPNRNRPPAAAARAVGGGAANDDDDGLTASPASRPAPPPRWKSLTAGLPGWARWAAPLALVALGGGAFWMLRESPADPGATAAQATSGEPAPLEAAAKSSGASEASIHVADPAATPAAKAGGPAENGRPKKDPAELLRRGAAALAASDFAGAVLIYGELLKQDPENLEVQRQLRAASDAYREQRATQEKWKLAFEAFDDRRYTEALRLFYRLPAAGDPARLERYRVNGWYNLGVLALQSNDCKGAVSNFKEAEALRPRDPGVQAAMELGEACGRSSIRSQVEALRLRSLED